MKNSAKKEKNNKNATDLIKKALFFKKTEKETCFIPIVSSKNNSKDQFKFFFRDKIMPLNLPKRTKTYAKTKSAVFFQQKTLKAYILGSALVLSPASIALADETGSRFTMIESKNGIIRLDKKTGAMSNCKKSTTGWSCKPIKETTEASSHSPNEQNEELFSKLQKANEALEKENQILKQRIANLELGLNDEKSEKKLKLPTDEEVDEAITYMEKMIRKFGGAMKRLREKHPEVPGTEL